MSGGTCAGGGYRRSGWDWFTSKNTQDPRIQSTCYYSNSLNRQITFHAAQRVSVCNHTDRSSRTFIVTPRGMILDRSLTLPLRPRTPKIRCPPLHATSLRRANPRVPHLHLRRRRRRLPCWVNKAEPSSARFSWWLVTER